MFVPALEALVESIDSSFLMKTKYQMLHNDDHSSKLQLFLKRKKERK